MEGEGGRREERGRVGGRERGGESVEGGREGKRVGNRDGEREISQSPAFQKTTEDSGQASNPRTCTISVMYTVG